MNNLDYLQVEVNGFGLGCFGLSSTAIDYYGLLWTSTDPYGPQWTSIDSYGLF